MKIFTAVASACFSLIVLSGRADEKKKSGPAGDEEATRLQIFLDRAGFSPGKIDGHYGDFTLKALALYRASSGRPEPAAAPPKKGQSPTKAPPSLEGIDVSSVDSVFITYTVTGQDVETTGDLPKTIPEEAKLKWLPYRDVAEAVAEKFHCDREYLTKLNPGKAAQFKAGDEVRVPNVPPFDLAAVKDAAQRDQEAAKETSKAKSDHPGTEKKNETPPSSSALSIKIDIKANMLQVREGDHLVAAYPVTVGSAHTESPVGEWEVKEITRLPFFRYDKEMLNHGKRSEDYYNLAPGPNNLVGVAWIALNKKGIGLHGTNEPDTIGRSASHGCVRLANWDVVRLAEKLKPGVPVSIH